MRRQPRPDLPTGTVTFLFTDIEGSTRLAQQTEPEEFLRLLEVHYALIRGAIAAHEGVEIRTEGDAFFVVFSSAADGVRAAVAAQRALADHAWPDGKVIRVRMGLHTGEGRLGGADYFGVDVHRAARISDTAHGGQIVISAEVAGLIDPLLEGELSLADLGRHRLKDLNSPEHLYQVVGEGLGENFPELRSEGSSQQRLPTRLSSFVGRERDMEDITGLVRSHRLVTLTGPGGTGKTRLAEEVARRVDGEFGGGVFFIPLADITEEGLVVAAVADALGVIATDGDQQAQLVRHLASRRALLVLDNFEHVIDAAPLVTVLLEAAPAMHALVTSRAPLRLAGEREYEVTPLGVPTVTSTAPEDLLGFAGVRLFVDRAQEAVPSFTLAPDLAVDVAEIVRRVDGLPLAIELVAARSKVWPPHMLLAHLDTHLVGGSERDLPERQQTIRRTIGWSYDLLDDASRSLLEDLSVFVGGAGLDEIEQVVDVSGIDLWDVLGGLVDQSLVNRRDTLGDLRFGMLEMVREFAGERLDDRGAGDALRRRHAEAYLRLGQQTQPDLTGRRRADRLQRLGLEHGNLHAALTWATSAPEPELALEMVGSLWRFWQMAGHLDEAADHVSQALALEGGSPRARARALDAAGGIAYWRGDIGQQKIYYGAALDLWRSLGDDLEIANACYNLSYSTGITDGHEAGMALLLEAKAIFERHGDHVGLGRVYWALSNLLQINGDYEAAVELCERSIQHFGDDEVVFELGWAEFVLAENLIALERLDEAHVHLRRGMDLFLDAGDLSAMVLFLGSFAELAQARGDTETAMRLAGATNTLRLETGAGIVETDPAHAEYLSEEKVQAHAEFDAFQEGGAMSLDEALELALSIPYEAAPPAE